MKTVNVLLSPELKRELQTACSRLGLSMTAYIRLAIMEKLKKDGKEG